MGPAGPPGPGHGPELRRLTAQVNELARQLQVQLTRIAQIQAQLDQLTSGNAQEPKNRDESSRVDY
jgi:chaperonin cofactor prefoldin